MAKTILLAITSKEESENFSRFLKSKGLEAECAADGAKVIEAALKGGHSLVIVDMNLPVVSGERVFQILRNNPKTQRMPFVFVADSTHEVKGFRTGIDTFLVRPFQWEELYSGIKHSELAAEGGIGDKDIQGKLSQMPLVDILQVLHFNKKQGELTVTSAAETGKIYIKDGNIYNATLGEAAREKALYRLLSWKDGTFGFHPCNVTAERRITTSAGSVIMEGMRQLDEFEKSRPLFPDENSTLKTRVSTTTLPKGLKPVIYELLLLIEYYPKVKDLVDRSSFTDYEVYKTLVSLLGRRILEETRGATTGKTQPREFVTASTAIRVKERVITRWADMLTANFGRIFMAGTQPALVRDFVLRCKELPDFSVDLRLASSRDSNGAPIGEVGVLKLHGAMDLVLFSVPRERGMGPFLKAFTSNLVGLVLLWDEKGEPMLEDLAKLKKELSSKRQMPVLHVYGGAPLTKELAMKHRSLLKLERDEPVFVLGEGEAKVFEVFNSFFDELIKESALRP
jgi:CheY-like chemotaxis protein